MQTHVTFRHFKGQHPELHTAAEDAAVSLGKYHDGIISTNVEFINDSMKTVEFTVHLQGSTLKAAESSDDFHKSLFEAQDKIVRQIQKYKTKHISARTKETNIL